MASAVYSLRIFAHGGLVAAGGKVGPIVPAGLIYVLRDIDVRETTGAAGADMFVFNQVGGILWLPIQPPAGQLPAWQWRGRQVYAEGEQVGFQAFAGTWSVAASGYQLTLP